MNKFSNINPELLSLAEIREISFNEGRKEEREKLKGFLLTELGKCARDSSFYFDDDNLKLVEAVIEKYEEDTK